MRVLDSIAEFLAKKSSVQMVADDPVMAAEIMLLVRVMFADGQLQGAELDYFKGACLSLFDIPEEDVPEVIRFLKDYGYETSGVQAAASFQDMPEERRKTLMSHLIAMARVDNTIHAKELAMLNRVGAVLGFTEEQIRMGATHV